MPGKKRGAAKFLYKTGAAPVIVYTEDEEKSARAAGFSDTYDAPPPAGYVNVRPQEPPPDVPGPGPFREPKIEPLPAAEEAAEEEKDSE